MRLHPSASLQLLSLALLGAVAFSGCSGGTQGLSAVSNPGGGVPPEPVTAAVAAANTAQDLTPNLKALLITPGPLAGGFRLMKDDARLNWYFCNIGLVPFVTTANKALIKNYLDLFLKQADRSNGALTGSIQDYSDISKATKSAPDSNDAYAATFLTLASLYRDVSGDSGWWKSNVADLKALSQAALLAPQKKSGLIKAKMSGGDTGYLMDNCEDYGGLKDFANRLAADKDPAAAEYSAAAAKVAGGVFGLYDDSIKAFKAADAPAGSTFYPERTCQVFPQLYDVPVGSPEQSKARYDAAYAYLNARGDLWPVGQIKDTSLGVPPAQYPWMVLGTVAAKRGDAATAHQQLAYLLKNQGGTNPLPVFTAIQEIGFATRLQAASKK